MRTFLASAEPPPAVLALLVFNRGTHPLPSLCLALARYAAQVAYALTSGLRKLRASQRRARKAARKGSAVARDAAESANKAAVAAIIAARGAFQNSSKQKLNPVARRASIGRRRSSLDEGDVAVTAAAAEALMMVSEGNEKGSPAKSGRGGRSKSPKTSKGKK